MPVTDAQTLAWIQIRDFPLIKSHSFTKIHQERKTRSQLEKRPFTSDAIRNHTNA